MNERIDIDQLLLSNQGKDKIQGDNLFTPLKNERDAVPPQFKDRLWRLENLYYIQDKDGNKVLFKLNRAQMHLFKNLHHRNILLKARQLGMSTFTEILILDACLFSTNKNAAIVADKLENAGKLFDKIQFAWDNLDKTVKEAFNFTLESDSKSQMKFSNKSSIFVGTTLHGGTYQILHVSEYGPLCASYPEKAEIVKKSGLPTVPANGLIIIESTAEGEGNDYHSMTMEAMDAQYRGTELTPLDFKFFFFPWFEEPTYRAPVPEKFKATPEEMFNVSQDLYFKEVEEKTGIKLDWEQRIWYIKQEKLLKHRTKEQMPSYPEEAFLSSGRKLFDAGLLLEKEKVEVRRPLRMERANHAIFADYRRGHAYGLGADVALGNGRDSSTIVVIDFTEGEVVATYRNERIAPDVFAHEIAWLGAMYGTCIAAPENNNMGHTTVTTLHNVYPNIYTSVVQGYLEDKMTNRLGFSTNAATKPKMMYELNQAFVDGSLKVPDQRILQEARQFGADDAMMVNKSELTRHFDLLIGCAIAWQMRAYSTVTWDNPETKRRVEARREGVRNGVNNFN